MSNEIIYTAGDRTPYTYLIGWQKLDKWYYGVRYARGCHPGDFWVTYFTQSNHECREGNLSVKNMRIEFGEPDIIQIRKVFDCPRKSRLYEQRLLKRIKAVKDERFLNRTDNTSISLPNQVFAFLPSGAKFGFINIDDKRFETGELVRWGTQIEEDGLTKWQKIGLKTRLSNDNIDPESGLTKRELANIKRSKTVDTVLCSGSTLRELSIQKGLNTKAKTVDKYGNNVLKQIGIKANISKQIIGEDGLTTHQRTNLRIKLEKDKIRENGLTGHQIQNIKARITCTTPDKDGKTIYQKAAETRSRNQMHYDIYHVKEGIKMSNLTRTEVRNIHTSFFAHMTPDTCFGSTKKGLRWLTTTGKLHLLGYYVVQAK